MKKYIVTVHEDFAHNTIAEALLKITAKLNANDEGLVSFSNMVGYVRTEKYLYPNSHSEIVNCYYAHNHLTIEGKDGIVLLKIESITV